MKQKPMRAKAGLGKFQLRNGRAASIFNVKKQEDGSELFEGLLLPPSKQGKTETGYRWRADGSFSAAPVGVLHHLDLTDHVSTEITLPDNE